MRPSTPPLPKSYATHPFTQIALHHHPHSSPSVTPIIILELHRPTRNNAWTATMVDEIVEAYRMFDADDRVKCVVFTGSGRNFCVGADLDVGFVVNGEEGRRREREHRDGGGRAALAIYNSPKPTIGAINGSAVGIGITITLPMSIRLASSSAKIGFVFARRGIVMEACSAFFLPRLIGHSKALHLTTTGGVYPATSKLFDGLFSEVLEPERVLPRALEIAEEVAGSTSAVSTKLMRDMMWRGPGSAEEMHLLDSRVLAGVFGSRDNVEGVESFMGKRPAKFTATMQRDAPSVWPWWTPVDVGSESARQGVKDPKSKL